MVFQWFIANIETGKRYFLKSVTMVQRNLKAQL